MKSIFSATDLYNRYEDYRENSLEIRRFGVDKIIPLIERISGNSKFVTEESGKSILGKPIHSIGFGRGKTRVLMWSQMHGDEPTATMALFDFINFLAASDDFDYYRKKIFDNLTIVAVPMLNPDGAEAFTRENAVNIDLNRDALRLQCPESQLLKNLHKKNKPDFSFNLHDQNSRYTAGNSFKSAAVSLLAPPFNTKKEINSVRKKTMQVIVDIKRTLKKYIPGHIARYNDDFEPRAFGDNFVKWGTSSILIESGGWKDDPDKNYIRKMNFLAFCSGLASIATKSFKKNKYRDYYKIPENDKLIFDLLLRNLTLKSGDFKCKIDVGINRTEIRTANGIYQQGIIDDVGDLSTFYGFEEYDLENYEIIPAKENEGLFDSTGSINAKSVSGSLKSGKLIYRVNPANFIKDEINFPFLFIPGNLKPELSIKPGNYAFFSLSEKNNTRFVIANGFFIDNEIGTSKKVNGLLLQS